MPGVSGKPDQTETLSLALLRPWRLQNPDMVSEQDLRCFGKQQRRLSCCQTRMHLAVSTFTSGQTSIYLSVTDSGSCPTLDDERGLLSLIHFNRDRQAVK